MTENNLLTLDQDPSSILAPSQLRGTVGNIIDRKQLQRKFKLMQWQQTMSISNSTLPGSAFTFTYMMELESNITAIRLLFGNTPTGIALTLTSAAVAPSSTFPVGSSSVVSFVDPTGAFAWTPVTFDYTGADNDIIRYNGTARALTIPAGGTTNIETGSTIWWPFSWSDWVPTFTLPRTDGGTRPVICIRVCVPNTIFSQGSTNNLGVGGPGLGLSTLYGRNFTVFTTAGDYATTQPVLGAGVSSPNFSGALLGIQTISTVPGAQIIVTGDSRETGQNGNETYTSAFHQAALQLSTPTCPIAVWNSAWGAVSSVDYTPQATQAINACPGSIVFIKTYSGNEAAAGTSLGAAACFARGMMEAERVVKAGGIPILMTPAIGGTGIGGIPANLAQANNIRNLVLAQASTGYRVYDMCPDLFDNAGNYLPGLTTDLGHPNGAGIRAMQPRLMDLIKSVVGI